MNCRPLFRLKSLQRICQVDSQLENFDDERSDRVSRELEGFNKAFKKQWTFWKKAGVTTAAIAASFMLFVGSGFVSPTMAKMVAKIPPLNSIFESHERDLSELLTQALKKEGYPVKQVTEFVGGKNEGIDRFIGGI